MNKSNPLTNLRLRNALKKELSVRSFLAKPVLKGYSN